MRAVSLSGFTDSLRIGALGLVALTAVSSCASEARPVRSEIVVARVEAARDASLASAKHEQELPRSARTPPVAPVATPLEPCSPGALVADADVLEPVMGHFTAPDVEEIVGWIGCRPDNIDLGANALLRRSPRGLETVLAVPLFDSRISRSGCTAFRARSGRDLLVCRDGSAMYGVLDQSVVVIDFTKDPDDGETHLVRAVDTTDTACTGETQLLIGGVDTVEHVDLDHDAYDDLRITVREISVRVKPQPPCVQMGSIGAGQIPDHLPAAPRIKLDFVMGSNGFVPTAATLGALDKIAKLVATAAL
jgi:hypothetical protein